MSNTFVLFSLSCWYQYCMFSSLSTQWVFHPAAVWIKIQTVVHSQSTPQISFCCYLISWQRCTREEMQQRSKARFKDVELTRVYISTQDKHPSPPTIFTPLTLTPTHTHTFREKLSHKAATTRLQRRERNENFLKCWGTGRCICSEW